jgi:5'-methylthioadenosine phosphorylase
MLGIIGGTGLYKIDGLSKISTRTVHTPFGSPSADTVIGELDGQRIAFLPRHGLHHQILPSEINFRANIWALKSVGVRKIISVSAVGSLRKEIRPGDLAILAQYFDWTHGTRIGTFFGDGLVAHVSTARPACPALMTRIAQTAAKNGMQIHMGKTYGCVQGPRLGTMAESHFLRSAGCDLVGMTNIPEAFLAREAQLCYSTIAIALNSC